MLLTRIGYGILLIAGLTAIFWGDIVISEGVADPAGARGLSCGSIIPLAIVLLSVFGTLELLNLTRAAGYVPMGRVIVFGVILIHLVAWSLPALDDERHMDPFEGQMLVLVLVSLAIGILQVARRRTLRGIGDISVSIMILIYMGVLPSMMIALRCSLPGAIGSWAILFFVATVKMSDIAAYFVGVAFGKTKLIPSISPGKTLEGLGGGVVFAIVCALVLSRILPLGESEIGYLQAVLFGVLMAGIGQVGDLVESIFKRDAELKDSGQVIPAFGGILDLMDSPIFASPVAYILLKSWLE